MDVVERSVRTLKKRVERERRGEGGEKGEERKLRMKKRYVSKRLNPRTTAPVYGAAIFGKMR